MSTWVLMVLKDTSVTLAQAHTAPGEACGACGVVKGVEVDGGGG